MSKIIFNLKSVPYDEADDIKNLLTENRMSFFESPPGNWGISVHALWLNDDAQYIQARQLIDDYQLKRSEQRRQEIQEQKNRGEYETFFQRLLNRPLQYIFILAFILFILYLSIVPFFEIPQV